MPNGIPPHEIDPGVVLPEEDSLVMGVNAVVGAAEHIAGVRGFNRKGGPGVMGVSKSGEGVVGAGATNGLHGQSRAADHSGVWGENIGKGFGVAGSSVEGIGVFGSGGRLAAFFDGDVEVTGDIRLVNADCAEEFDIRPCDAVEPGTVMVISEDGTLRQSQQAYDKRVAGVVSGAGSYRPAIVLDTQQSERDRQPIALLGKVYCKADARYGAIELGDLLTTSLTSGHAMKAADPLKAFGAVIGKALRPLREGQALIPILIALQ